MTTEKWVSSRSTYAGVAATILVLLAAGCGGEAIVSEETGSGGSAGAGGGIAAGGSAGSGGGIAAGGSAGAGGGIAAGGSAGSGGIAAGGSAGSGGGIAAGGAAGAAIVDASAGGSADAADVTVAPVSTDAADAATSSCPRGVQGHCSSASYPAYPGFTLNLVEDFDAPLDLATDPVWTYSDGVGDSNYTRFQKDALSFANGGLIITATKPAGGVANAGAPTYASGTQATYPTPVSGRSAVASGELRSKYNNYRYGRYEARMKAPGNNRTPDAVSIFIAAVFTHRSPSWQEWREVGAEITPYNAATSIGTNIVFGNGCSNYGCTANNYQAKPIFSSDAGPAVYDDFHTYAIELLPTEVRWFVDGAKIRTETGTKTKLPEKSMKLMVTLWVYPMSCSWGGCPTATYDYPMESEIDWIRFYKYDGEDTYPCTPTPTCLPYEDRDYAKNNAEDGIPAVLGDP